MALTSVVSSQGDAVVLGFGALGHWAGGRALALLSVLLLPWTVSLRSSLGLAGGREPDEYID
ncbi:MAG: hypothetical protein ACI8QS_000138 [Planctomycetota bacterium]|jgi:hypothetical protein